MNHPVPLSDTTTKIRSSYRVALTGPNGSEVLADLIKAYVLTRNPYSDSIQMARFEGRRDIVLMLLSLVKGDPEVEADHILSTNSKEKEKD